MVKVLIGLIRFYQRVISPWKVPCCRFYPTCSEYTIEAIREYGLIFGVFLALKRMLKCHPFHPGGYDPLDTDWHPIPSPPRRTSLRGRSASYGAGGLKVHGWAQINKNLLRRTLFTSYLDETSEVRRRKSAEYLKANEVR